ncbi:MAG: hypothetical protein LBG69_01945 [Zoogloeaceae bacterium]|jgi:hypothetical protein|nr:hypothetical protein [Zoogloeaceae bacterium]
MENRSKILAACVTRAGCFFCLFLLCAAVRAENADFSSADSPPQAVEVREEAFAEGDDSLLERGKALQEEAARRRDAMEDSLAEETAQCDTRFFVNDCKNAARARYLEALEKTRSMEMEGRALERRWRLSRRAAQEEEREKENLKRATEDAGRAKTIAKQRAEQEARAARKKQDKAMKAEKKRAKREKRRKDALARGKGDAESDNPAASAQAGEKP